MADATRGGENPLTDIWSGQGSYDGSEWSRVFDTFETPKLELPESLMIPKSEPLRGSGWGTVHRKISYLPRAIGLSLASMIFDPDANQPEVKKVVIQKSFWVALGRCCIHFPPLAVSVVIFWFNFSRYFVGAQLYGSTGVSDNVKFQILQFVAKAHELLIISSTGSIVFHVLRNQLFEGN